MVCKLSSTILLRDSYCNQLTSGQLGRCLYVNISYIDAESWDTHATGVNVSIHSGAAILRSLRMVRQF